MKRAMVVSRHYGQLKPGIDRLQRDVEALSVKLRP